MPKHSINPQSFVLRSKESKKRPQSIFEGRSKVLASFRKTPIFAKTEKTWKSLFFHLHSAMMNRSENLVFVSLFSPGRDQQNDKKIRLGALLTAEDRWGENRDFSICTSLPTRNLLPVIPVKFIAKSQIFGKSSYKNCKF